ncbi:hypothetical protein B484DRAFT_441016, partial [Ochromonadaceae sp. CCMP2298]
LDTATVEPLGDGANFLVLVDTTWTLQLFSIGYQNPNNKNIDELEVQKSFLLQYMNYELNYFKNEVKMAVENQKAGWGPVGDKHFLLWHFDTPDYPTVQKQMYLSTIVFDNFLNINIPLTNGQDFDEGMNFLKKVAASLVLHEHPIDVEAFYKEVNGL